MGRKDQRWMGLGIDRRTRNDNHYIYIWINKCRIWINKCRNEMVQMQRPPPYPINSRLWLYGVGVALYSIVGGATP